MEKQSRVFKILAIDGGGIKGLYTSTILEHFEEQFSCSLSDYFDLICGTSTGGLIALGLSQKIPAHEVSRVYKDHGKAIFPSPPQWLKWLGTFRQTLFRGKYTDQPLRRVLEEMFGDKRIGASHNLLCIPSYSITEGRPWVFKYDHAEGDLCRDNQARYVDVALATAAAPTYFPVSEIPYYDHKQFVDGGVWANNPTLVGVIEALRYFVGKGKAFDSLEVLSVSSLSLKSGKPVGLRRRRAFIDWKGDLFETSLNGQSEFTHYVMSSLCDINDVGVRYVRIPSAEVSYDQTHLVEMDSASPKSLALLAGKANDMGVVYRKKPEIATFFQQQKLYNLKPVL